MSGPLKHLQHAGSLLHCKSNIKQIKETLLSTFDIKHITENQIGDGSKCWIQVISTVWIRIILVEEEWATLILEGHYPAEFVVIPI